MTSTERIVIFFAKCIAWGIKITNRGAGATWPGEIALRLKPHILKEFAKQHIQIILVAGTNGKTTTTKMIDTILKKNGKKVHRNDTGANLDNGVVSAFISDCTLFGNLRSQYFIFEVDEATLPVLLRHFHPHILVLLNLFRDQLDRYGEVDTIAEKWTQVFSMLPSETRLIINADDPQLGFIGQQVVAARLHLNLKDLFLTQRMNESVENGPHESAKANVQYFGLNDPEAFSPYVDHATDSIYCPNCGNRLTFGGIYFSHLGKYACGQCGFIHPELSIKSKDITYPLEGVYNRYNTLAAYLVGREVGLDNELIQQALSDFIPAFGRMEEINYHRRKIRILLSKNPTGWNESLRTMLTSEKKGPVLLVLNDRIPDGRDVSWIWDTDIEMLSDFEYPIVASGDRAYDLGLRLKYSGISNSKFVTFERLEEAIEKIVSVSSADETIWILPTYSAMLEIRSILVGRKIL